jgi:subtilisin family serine protease
MKIDWMAWTLAASFVVSGCSGFDTRPSEASGPGTATSGQILVMLKERSTVHYRPGSFSSPSYASGPAPPAQLRIARELAAEYGFKIISDWPMPAIGVRCFVAEVPQGRAPEDVVSRLATDPRVESVQAVQMFRAVGHNDPYYELQTNAKRLNLDELHRFATGRHVKVAQIDTGVELNHPDLDGQLFDARNFVDGTRYVPESHGTAVAGLIVAKADNRLGIVGIAPAATLMPLRACWENQDEPGALCSSFTVAKAMQWVLNHPTAVLNLSLAGPRDRLLERLIEKAIDQGITVVGAVDPDHPEDSFPATHPGVIAVGSAGTAIAVAGEILGPGEHLLTTTRNGSWGFVSGSSYAAAQITGIAALMHEGSRKLGPKEVSFILREHVHQSGEEAGLVDACGALASVYAGLECGCCDIAHPSARHQARAPKL